MHCAKLYRQIARSATRNRAQAKWRREQRFVRSAKRLGVTVEKLHETCDELAMTGTEFLRYLAIGSFTLAQLEAEKD
jgi:hypothetical protein